MTIPRGVLHHPRAAIVSHGGILRAMLADCLRMRDERIFGIGQSYGALSHPKAEAPRFSAN